MNVDRLIRSVRSRVKSAPVSRRDQVRERDSLDCAIRIPTAIESTGVLEVAR